MSVLDFGLPDQVKAFQSVTLFYENTPLDAEHTIEVRFGMDGASPDGTLLGTANSSGTSTTFYFNNITSPETAAIGRAIQFEIRMATDDTVSPRLYAIVVRANYEPARVRRVDCFIRVGNNLTNLQGVAAETITLNSASAVPTKVNIITALETLEAQEYPPELAEDFDDDDTQTLRRVRILRDSIRRVGFSERDPREEIWALSLQEVQVS